MPRLMVLLMALLMCSGCCELFGVCTSASIHTSIQSDQEYAQQGVPAQEPMISQYSQQARW